MYKDKVKAKVRIKKKEHEQVDFMPIFFSTLMSIYDRSHSQIPQNLKPVLKIHIVLHKCV